MSKNLESLQFLRFVAATLVVFSHSTQGISKYVEGGIPSYFMYISSFGGVGVHIFFVISGFIMVYSSFIHQGRTFSSPYFLIRRFIRIYPTYWIYASFYIFFHQSNTAFSIEGVTKSLLLAPGYSSLIIGPGWSLSYEVYFYLCFSIAMILPLRRGLVVLTLFFLMSIALQFVFNVTSPTFHLLTNSLLVEFLLGAWLGWFVVSGKTLSGNLSNAMLICALAGFFIGVVFGYHRLPSVVVWGIPSAFLVAGLVFNELNGNILNLVRKCSFLGDSSYSLYLLHVLLIDVILALVVFFNLFLIASSWFVLCFALTILCIAISFLCYEVIERRVVVCLQKLVQERTVQLPATKQVG